MCVSSQGIVGLATNLLVDAADDTVRKGGEPEQLTQMR
jgi:hypothetical protein